MAYGFRLFYFEVRNGLGRSALDLAQEIEGQRPADLLSNLLTAVAADTDTTRWAMPSLQNAADGTDITPETPNERGHRAIKWVSASRPGTLHLSTTVKYGAVQGHAVAIGRPQDIDIVGTAPAHEYRVEILLPKSGDTGLIVSEDIDRHCPGPAVAQWLSKESKTSSGAGPWWRVRTEPVADSKRLEDLIANAKKAEIRLKADGKMLEGGRYQKPVVVTVSVDQNADRDTLIGAVKGWVKKKPSKTESVLTLQTIAGGEIANMSLDEGDLYLEDAVSGHRIKPDKLNDVFIYETGQARLTQEGWAATVRAKLSDLHGILKFDVEW